FIACVQRVRSSIACGKPLELYLCPGIFGKKLFYNKGISRDSYSWYFIINRSYRRTIGYTGLGHSSTKPDTGLRLGSQIKHEQCAKEKNFVFTAHLQKFNMSM